MIYGERSNNSWLSLAEDGSAEPLPELYIDERCPFDGLCSAPATMVAGRLVFAMYSQSGLGFTDGTAAGNGAIPLKDGQGYDSAVRALGRFGDQALVLGGFGNLWSTDGTVLGTRFITNRTSAPVSAGGRFYLIVCKAQSGCELWSTDRLGEDTRIVQDLWPGPRGSDPYILNVSEDALWFVATEPSVGRELWKIDLSAFQASPEEMVPELSSNRETSRTFF